MFNGPNMAVRPQAALGTGQMPPIRQPYTPPNAGSPTSYAPNASAQQPFDHRMLQSQQQINDAAGIAPRLAVPHVAPSLGGSVAPYGGGIMGQSTPQPPPGMPAMPPAGGMGALPSPQAATGNPMWANGLNSIAQGVQAALPQVSQSVEPGMPGYGGPMPPQSMTASSNSAMGQLPPGVTQNIPGGLYQQASPATYSGPQQGIPGIATVMMQPQNLPGGSQPSNSQSQMLAALLAQYPGIGG